MDHHHRHLCSYCMQIFCLFVLFIVLKKEEVISRWLALNMLSFCLTLICFLFYSVVWLHLKVTLLFFFLFPFRNCQYHPPEMLPHKSNYSGTAGRNNAQDTDLTLPPAFKIRAGHNMQWKQPSSWLHLSDQQEDTLGPLKTTFTKTILHAPSRTCSTPFHSHTHTMTQSRCDACKTTCQNDITGVCASTKPDPKKQTDMPLSLILFKRIGNTLKKSSNLRARLASQS